MGFKEKLLVYRGKIEAFFIKIKWSLPRRRFIDLVQLFKDFTKKCNEDHVTAFAAMSAFFILLSLLPFMIFLLTMAQYLPFTKEDIMRILSDLVSFEDTRMVYRLINEVYHKTSASVFTVSIIAALWSSSKGIFSIVKGLNSVFDIEDNRNFIVLRCFSMIYTILFAFILIAMLILWVFGNSLYAFVSIRFPVFEKMVSLFIHRGTILTFIVLVIIFCLMYQFIPARTSRLFKQLPGAIIAGLGWIAVSELCAMYMDNFSNFTYIYGSMAGIMILLIWMYFCMSMIFYGAEVNYFLENQHNYHALIRILRPNFREARRQKEKEMKKELVLRRQEERAKLKELQKNASK